MRHSLVVLNGPAMGTSLSLDPSGDGVTIGRDRDLDVPIDDQLASRLHARIWFDGRQWRVADNSSRNGTWVNSRRVERVPLAGGDMIRIGERLLVFVEESDEEGSPVLPSVLAQSTFTERIVEPARDVSVLGRLDSSVTGDATLKLSLLYESTTALQKSASIEDAIRLVEQTLMTAVVADRIETWLAGADGRLRLGAGSTGSRRRAKKPSLEVSLAIGRDEAFICEPGASDEKATAQSTMGVPIPGQGPHRGAIYSVRDTGAFAREDLEFAVALANQLGSCLANLEQSEQLRRSNEELRRRVTQHSRILGESHAARQLHDRIARIAATNSTVLIGGESGSGKELVAQSLHQMGERADGPFVTVNCAAFSETLLESELFGHEAGAFTGADRRRIGQFEQADHGTIFLDEIGELSPACQAKLLRILEGHPYERLGGSNPICPDVRIVAATHRDIEELTETGEFREDLYYRLQVVEIQVPPLRERGDDILLLASHFVDLFRRQIGRGPARLSAGAAEALLGHPWHGNVRELKNAVERAVVLGQEEEIAVEDLALRSRRVTQKQAAPLVALDEAERNHIDQVLKAVGGNKTRACKILRIGRATLYNKLSRGSASPE